MKLKKLNMAVLILLCLGILTTYCGIGNILDGGSQDGPSTVQYLSFEDYGCASNGLNKNTMRESIQHLYFDNRNYVKSCTYQNDTLGMEIHYIANCCPEFADSVTVTGSNIEIYLKDNLAGCHCICEYENLFSFYATGLNETHVKFHAKGPYELNYTTLIDTVFAVNE